MGKILVVGLCCIDLVNYVQRFPDEDSDTRVFEQCTTLGGNAANTCTVLSQLDSSGYELFASVPQGNVLLESLIAEHQINLKRVEHAGATIPISTAVVNETKGTRTILHYRGNLPELSAADFEQSFPNLDDFSWIHFEGRNFDETLKIVKYCKQKCQPSSTRISIELEKIRDFNWYESLVSLVDLIFMSKDFARNLGFTTMKEAVEGFQLKLHLDKTTLIVPWGEEGVTARAGLDGALVVQQAHHIERVIDTLAAGDCFIGASLHFLNRGCSLEVVLDNASRIAGQKCGQRGLLNLDLSWL